MPDDYFAAAVVTIGGLLQVAHGKRSKLWPRLGPADDHDTDYARWLDSRPRRVRSPLPFERSSIPDTEPFTVPSLAPMTWSDGSEVLWGDDSTVYWSTTA